MTYIVLARKWRPTKFEEVIGQEHVTRTLVNALKQQRVAHAYIFAGPRGVGKTTTARLLAKAVNCEKQPAVNPCNECNACQAINTGNSLDVIEIDGASNRGIDEIRNLRENIRFTPANLKYKIYIIDEVHMLTKEAFNALLKTLEEPPSHAIFIFATTEIHKVPLTILSRCQRFDFKRIPTAAIANHLKLIATRESIDIDDESLTLIARRSEGSMRDAQSILDQLISYTDGKITAEKVRESLGIINEEFYFELTDLILDKDDASILNFVQKIVNTGHDLMDFLYGLEEHFRNLLVVKSTQSTERLNTSDYFKKLYQEKAAHFQPIDLLQFIEILIQGENILKFSPNPQLVLELLLLKLASKPKTVEIEQLLDMLQKMPETTGLQRPAASTLSTGSTPSAPVAAPPKIQEEKKTVYRTTPRKNNAPKVDWSELKTNALPKSSPSPETTTSPKTRTTGVPQNSIDFKQLQESWDKFVEAVKRNKIALGSFLQDSVPYRLEGNTLQLAFDPSTSFHMEHVQKNIPVIEKIWEKAFDVRLRVQCLAVDFQKAGIEKKVHTAQEIIDDIKNKEPVLKKIIELFDCENLDEEGTNP